MRIKVWMALAAFLPNGALASIPYVYPFNTMTAQEVVDQLLKEPKTQLEYINSQRAEAYLNGIKDAAHGRDWCLVKPMLPRELNAELTRHLKTLRHRAELNGNAAPLVLAELSRRFPCKKNKLRETRQKRR